MLILVLQHLPLKDPCASSFFCRCSMQIFLRFKVTQPIRSQHNDIQQHVRLAGASTAPQRPLKGPSNVSCDDCWPVQAGAETSPAVSVVTVLTEVNRKWMDGRKKTKYLEQNLHLLFNCTQLYVLTTDPLQPDWTTSATKVPGLSRLSTAQRRLLTPPSWPDRLCSRKLLELIWRLQEVNGNVTSLRHSDPPPREMRDQQV